MCVCFEGGCGCVCRSIYVFFFLPRQTSRQLEWRLVQFWSQSRLSPASCLTDYKRRSCLSSRRLFYSSNSLSPSLNLTDFCHRFNNTTFKCPKLVMKRLRFYKNILTTRSVSRIYLSTPPPPHFLSLFIYFHDVPLCLHSNSPLSNSSSVCAKGRIIVCARGEEVKWKRMRS